MTYDTPSGAPTYTKATVLENAYRLIKAATGGDYGDGYTVTDVCIGYAEPGYPTDPSAVIVFGNWNPRSVEGVTDPRAPHGSDNDRWGSKDNRVTMPCRLFDALERVGAECEWSDEWSQCSDCYRAVRTTENSYSWRPSYAWFDGGISCHECLIGCGEDALAGFGVGEYSYVNDPSKCVAWCEPSHVESFGYVKWNEQTYESGWHPGQDDKPEAIFAEIKAAHPDASVVFLLDDSSQFYIRFSAYVRFADSCSEDGGHDD